MHRPEEAYEESQSRSERCTVCENYYTRGDIASKISKGEPVICFYCYRKSHDKMLTFNEEIKMDYKMHGVRPTMRLSLKASIEMIEPKLSKKRITKIAEMVMDTMYIKMDDRELPIVPPFIHPSI